MKVFFACMMAALACLAVAATFPPLSQGRDFKVNNASNTVAITVQKSGTVASNYLEAFSGSNLKFAVPASGHLPITYGGTGSNTAAGARHALGFDAGAGTTATDGTVTQSFNKTFTATPIVVCTASNSVPATNKINSTTTTNFVFTCGEPSVKFNWIAVGTP